MKPAVMIPFSINIPARCSEILDYRIFSSSNGLVIVHCNYNYFHVYNPMTRQSRKISLSPNDSYHRVKMLHLVFDPSKSLHYKIVCIRAERQMYKIEVFDSENGAWKACMEPITIPIMLGFTNSVYCNNKIYVTDYTSDGSLYCIDIDKNVVRFMTSPTFGMDKGIAYAELNQELNGCVYYSALLYSVVSGQWACLWEKSELEDDKWLLKHNDRLPLPVRWSDHVLLRFIPQMGTLLILVNFRKIMAYSFLEKRYNEILSLQIGCEGESIHVFDQTLAPV